MVVPHAPRKQGALRGSLELHESSATQLGYPERTDDRRMVVVDMAATLTNGISASTRYPLIKRPGMVLFQELRRVAKTIMGVPLIVGERACIARELQRSSSPIRRQASSGGTSLLAASAFSLILSRMPVERGIICVRTNPTMPTRINGAAMARITI